MIVKSKAAKAQVRAESSGDYVELREGRDGIGVVSNDDE